jgi:hypothetical protein
MKLSNNKFQSLLPHAVALALFLALTAAYFSPAFQGYGLKQSDISSYIGMAKEHNDFRAETGEEALWTNSMFGGMPTYQIGLEHNANLLSRVDLFLKSIMPHGVIMALYYFIGFYILLVCMRINPWVAIVGALAFGYSSYFYIILEAGHMSKAQAIALMGPVLGAAILVYRGKILVGSAMFALFFGLELVANHYQMTFYLGFVLLFFGLYQLSEHIKSKELPGFFKKTAFLFLAATLAIGANAGRIVTTFEYAKESIRGKTDLSAELLGKDKAESTGLSTDYITQWSYGLGESYTLFVPNTKGGASGALFYDDVVNMYQGKGKAKKEAKKNLSEVDEDLKEHVIAKLQKGQSVNTYWGAQPFTSGPVYIGAVVVFLFIISFVLWKSRLKWFFLVLIGFSLMLSWGKNFMPLTQFFIDNLPFYNKFRAVSMMLVMLEFLVPIFAFVGVNAVVKNKNLLIENKNLLLSVGAVFLTGVLIITAIPTTFFNFLSARESYEFLLSNNSKIAVALVDYRVGEFRMDSLRSLAFVAVTIAALYAYAQDKLKANMLILLLGVFVLVDMWSVDKRYLNNDKQGKNYVSWQKNAKKFAPYQASPADIGILQRELNEDGSLQSIVSSAAASVKKVKGQKKKDAQESASFGALNLNTNYRVYKLGGNAFQESGTSYFHKSVGGYHAIKLSRYQNLITFALERENTKISELFKEGDLSKMADLQILNMMNMKYLIYDPEQQALGNQFANGNAWYVDAIRQVETADDEILALNDVMFDSKREAIIQKTYLKKYLKETGLKEAALNLSAGERAIEMTDYSPNQISYQTNSQDSGLVVFSEIYYDKGWQAYIDGEKVDHLKANYTLRSLFVPSGSHDITFSFEPRSFYGTVWVSYLCSALILFFALFIAFKWFKNQEVETSQVNA